MNRSAVGSRIERVLAGLKDQMGLFIRTIGLARPEVKVGLAQPRLQYRPSIFHKRRAATG